MKSRLIANIILLATVVLLTTTSALAKRKRAAVLPGVDIAVQNAGFEQPNLALNTWTTNDVPSWDVLPGTWGGVWHSGERFFQAGVQIEGVNTLWLSAGGVAQTLPINLQALADYTLSLDWYNRKDLNAVPLTLQFVAGGEVLASCTPAVLPSDRQSATVTLAYHSNGTSLAVGQPLSIRILVGPAASTSGAQVNVDDVQVSFADRTGESLASFTTTQECSLTFSK